MNVMEVIGRCPLCGCKIVRRITIINSNDIVRCKLSNDILYKGAKYVMINSIAILISAKTGGIVPYGMGKDLGKFIAEKFKGAVESVTDLCTGGPVVYYIIEFICASSECGYIINRYYTDKIE